jgi:hypothetical protein
MFADYPKIAHTVYSFNIDIVNGDVVNATTDERIGITIVEAFKSFFRRIDNVAVYICDISDDRQGARKRKFDFWFWKYSDGSIIKEDGAAVFENLEIINSLLVHVSNPHLTDIIAAFKDLNAKAGDK